MSLIKQYIIQSIAAASNNLRLTTQKIEVVALLRETIAKSEDLEGDIKKMKKITELSTLAIRLNEIYAYLTQAHIDFFKLSDKFKEHSQYLIKDLSHMLEMVNPVTFKKVMEKLTPPPPEPEPAIEPVIAIHETGMPDKEDGDKTAVMEQSVEPVEAEKAAVEDAVKPEKSENDKLKEKIILEDDKEDDELLFQNYEANILRPIKTIDTLLKQLLENKADIDELTDYSAIMEKNAELSEKIGFEIIANMHLILANGLRKIESRDLAASKDVIESMRACLIVIAAVVRGKEVDITIYLNKAEEFGKRLKDLNDKGSSK